MVLRPGEDYPSHHHRFPYLSVMLEDARVVLSDPTGEEEELALSRGDFVWRSVPETHSVRNVGPTPFRNRLIELVA